MPRVAGIKTWRATMTPLASIIGSGFLVLGPILDSSYGKYAPLAMLALCIGAYLFGTAIRHNIHMRGDQDTDPGRLVARLEMAGSWVLAVAYVISVAYYLNLFGAFGVSLTPWDDSLHARLLTSAVFALILVVGWLRGFSALERMEQVSVSVKLAIILGLLVGLAIFFGKEASADKLVLLAPKATGWAGIALGFGLIVTVQGFETSRYLGSTYDAQTRIRSMRIAQLLSSAIYMMYIALVAYVFQGNELHLEETAIIDMMRVVAPVLPFLLVAAALTAQFSAAIADTSGSGGLVAELTGGRVTERQAYAMLVGVGLAFTWTIDLFEIISYASRAFAIYYAIQSAIAAVSAHRAGGQWRKVSLFTVLTVLGLLIAAFGTPAEGGSPNT
ncbi:MAG: APC family permease [Alphaproteobacteria bacterium]|nr:APC family permease [Alphaproteobacteria bacterium]